MTEYPPLSSTVRSFLQLRKSSFMRGPMSHLNGFQSDSVAAQDLPSDMMALTFTSPPSPQLSKCVLDTAANQEKELSRSVYTFCTLYKLSTTHKDFFFVIELSARVWWGGGFLHATP